MQTENNGCSFENPVERATVFFLSFTTQKTDDRLSVDRPSFIVPFCLPTSQSECSPKLLDWASANRHVLFVSFMNYWETGIPQTSRAYSRTVRSLENCPACAVFARHLRENCSALR